MTPTQTHRIYKQILSSMAERKLKAAFDDAVLLNNELNSSIHRQNLESMQSNYRFMLRYFMEGVADPEREMMYNKMVARLFVTAARLRDELLTRDSSNFEFSQKRYFPHKPQMSADEILKKVNRKELMADLSESSDASQIHTLQTDFEEALQYLFYYFWLTDDYNQNGMMELYHSLMNDDFDDSTLKSMLISALTLNLWRTFDESKLMMLFDAATLEDPEVKQRTLTGLAFILAKYNRQLPYFPSVRNRLVLMADKPSTVENLQNIIIQIIATSETDEITKKLQEEIFPELMKLSPLIQDGLTGDNPLGYDEWGDINPEWQEMIESSGASDKIQELADMEMSGADVYMSTFSMLKSFPFFSEFSNWFLPFDSQHTAVNLLFEGEEKSLLSAFINSPAMCNSDRYSFCMSVLQMPEMQRNMMKHNFSEAAEQMEEQSRDEAMLQPQVRAKTISKHYIQDLFRFFKLSQHRADFGNMFKTSLLMHRTYLFDLLSADEDIKRNIAEFYFSKKMYPQALELFSELEQENDVSAEFYQKMGYAYQQNSQLTEALNAYKKADLIKPDDFWTLRKIAFCYRLTGDNENALKSYRHADFIKPGNLTVKLNIVNSLVEAGRNDEALQELTALHQEHGDNPRLLRATMKTAFAAHNMAQAEYFAGQLIDSGSAEAADFVYAGMVAWAMNRQSDTRMRFTTAFDMLEGDSNRFAALIQEEKELLISNHVEESEIALLIDAVSYGEAK